MSTAPGVLARPLEDARARRREAPSGTASTTCTSSARSRAPSRSPARRGSARGRGSPGSARTRPARARARPRRRGTEGAAGVSHGARSLAGRHPRRARITGPRGLPAPERPDDDLGLEESRPHGAARCAGAPGVSPCRQSVSTASSWKLPSVVRTRRSRTIERACAAAALRVRRRARPARRAGRACRRAGTRGPRSPRRRRASRGRLPPRSASIRAT